MSYEISIVLHEETTPTGISQEEYETLNDFEKSMWDELGGPGLDFQQVGKFFYIATIQEHSHKETKMRRVKSGWFEGDKEGLTALKATLERVTQEILIRESKKKPLPT